MDLVVGQILYTPDAVNDATQLPQHTHNLVCLINSVYKAFDIPGSVCTLIAFEVFDAVVAGYRSYSGRTPSPRSTTESTDLQLHIDHHQ